MRKITPEIRKLLIEYVLDSFQEYEWFESKQGIKYGYFNLVVKLHGKLVGVYWNISGINNNYAEVQLSITVCFKNIIGQYASVNVPIKKWELIPKDAELWNHKEDGEDKYMPLMLNTNYNGR